VAAIIIAGAVDVADREFGRRGVFRWGRWHRNDDVGDHVSGIHVDVEDEVERGEAQGAWWGVSRGRDWSSNRGFGSSDSATFAGRAFGSSTQGGAARAPAGRGDGGGW
jgi:hypothetical protein